MQNKWYLDVLLLYFARTHDCVYQLNNVSLRRIIAPIEII